MRHYHYKYPGILENGRRVWKGGGDTIVQAPPPTPQPSTADAVKAWVDAMPQVYQAQLEYAPKEAAQQMQMLQQYALPLAMTAKTAQEALYPETSALQEQLAGQSSAGMEQGLTAREREQYGSDVRSLLGDNVASPIGADYYGRSMMDADIARKDYYRNLGLSLAGRQPLAQPSSPSYSNFMGSFTPQNSMSFMGQNYGNYLQASRPLGWYNNNQQNMQSFGGLLGGIGGAAAGIMAL
jgi:hypothetical protein